MHEIQNKMKHVEPPRPQRSASSACGLQCAEKHCGAFAGEVPETEQYKQDIYLYLYIGVALSGKTHQALTE